jgi:hypothetical protein
MSPLLYFEEGPYKGTAAKFSNFVIIGSADYANLRLDDPTISPIHLAILKGNDGYYAINLDKNNKLLINETFLEASKIANGDLILLTQECQIRFVADGSSLEEAREQYHKSVKGKKIHNKVVKENNKIVSAYPTTSSSSSFSKILGICGWIGVTTLIFFTSFLSGVYATNLILDS